eukprot:SAG22_NODE_6721_length_819_cov_5.279167_1_plen_138_part_01
MPALHHDGFNADNGRTLTHRHPASRGMVPAVTMRDGTTPASRGTPSRSPAGMLRAAAAALLVAGSTCTAACQASPCHCAMLKWCNSSAAPLAGKGAACTACEAAHAAPLSAAGCGGDRTDRSGKLYRFCAGPSPPGPP